MEKIKLYYKDILLGYYYYDSGYYIFENDEKNMQLFKQEYPASFIAKGFSLIKNKSKELFVLLQEYVDDIRQRPDLIYQLKISANDSDFDILNKFATTGQDKFDFWIDK